MYEPLHCTSFLESLICATINCSLILPLMTFMFFANDDTHSSSPSLTSVLAEAGLILLETCNSEAIFVTAAEKIDPDDNFTSKT